MSYQKHTYKEYNLVLQLRNKGLKYREISDNTSISLGTVENWCTGRRKPFIGTISKIFTRTKMTKEFAYVLGVLCGDGWIKYDDKWKCYSIGLLVTDKDFISEFGRCLSKTVREKIKIKYVGSRETNFGISKPFYRIYYCNKGFLEYLCSIGDYKSTTWEIDTSKILGFEGDFLRGFYDSDGCIRTKRNGTVISAWTASKNGCNILNKLLNNIGIRRVNNYTRKNPIRDLYTLEINRKIDCERFRDFIGATIKRKRDKLPKYIKDIE